MHRPVAVGLVVTLLWVAGAAPMGVAAATATGGAFDSPDDFDTTTFEIRAYANGSIRWTFVYSRTLANETERRQFQEYAERFNSEETDTYTQFKRRARLLVEGGSNATGREMRAGAFRREASLNELQNRGRVEMSFRWTNFSFVEGDRIVIGDVFEGGLYIGPNQRLVVYTGPGLSFSQVKPRPDSASNLSNPSVTWFGERQFADNRPKVVFTVAEADETPDDGGATQTTAVPTATPEKTRAGTAAPTLTTTAGTDRAGDDPAMLFLGILIVVLSLAAVVVWRTDAVSSPGGGSAPGSIGGEPPRGGTGTQEADAGTSEPAVPDEELLTDDDHVVRLLEKNDGRMKQVNIVEETGWSKSKVSMLLSDMEEEGKISKLRVGRENIISLRGQEPEAAGSPFEAEDE
ncbi:hypothetical protein BRC83_00275 [Halobacteriales archaeon QS_1_68_17]|nr:MAG: hypothetical protein BRC83_00275 [Halobacteriales archaeon QS_1_68_17]